MSFVLPFKKMANPAISRQIETMRQKGNLWYACGDI
jgi:hypothetical protein